MNIIKDSTPNKWVGGNTVQAIVIHQWNDPKLKPTLSGTVAWLKNPAAQVSAHYVVSGDTVVQLMNETDRAWHAMQANHSTIGIEIDPNVPGNTYKTVGELIRAIRGRRGNLPIRKHSDYVATACPNFIDVNRIIREAGVNTMTQRLTNKNHLKVLFNQFVNRDPTSAEYKDYINRQGTLDYALNKLHPARTDLGRLITERNALRKQVNDVKAALEAEQSKPPQTVIKEVERIVEVEVPVEVRVGEEEAVRGFFGRLLDLVFKK